jgi:uncharacterized membrane protein YhhN
MLTIISLLVLLSVGLLVRAAIKGDTAGGYVFKPLSTIIIVTAAVLSFTSPDNNTAYGVIITCGLLLSFFGDITLMLPWDKALPLGMAFFLLAHIIYGFGFMRIDPFSPADVILAAAILLFGLIIFTLLYPNLGKMRIPVLTYVIAISFMLWRALLTGSPLIMIGALLFYLADGMESYSRFMNKSAWIRPVYLSLYYAGQLLIALSISL